MCKFDEAYRGNCKADEEEDGFCKKHKETVCVVCKEQATHDCDSNQMNLVCGTPLCDKMTCAFDHKLRTHSGDIAHIVHDAVIMGFESPLIVVSKRLHTGLLEYKNGKDDSLYITILLKVVEEGKEQYKVYRHSRPLCKVEEKGQLLEALTYVYGIEYTDVYQYDGIIEDTGYLPFAFTDNITKILDKEKELIQEYLDNRKVH